MCTQSLPQLPNEHRTNGLDSRAYSRLTPYTVLIILWLQVINICLLGVFPAYRRAGVASMLLSQVLNSARKARWGWVVD